MNTRERMGAIMRWLEGRDLAYGASLYTQEEWRKRKEPFGGDAVITLTAEGPFNHEMNHGDGKVYGAFTKLVKGLGLHMEQGLSWSWHLHEDPEAKLSSDPRRAKVARQANEAARGSRRVFPNLSAASSPESLIDWLMTNDLNASWREAYDDGEVSEEDLWDAVEAESRG